MKSLLATILLSTLLLTACEQEGTQALHHDHDDHNQVKHAGMTKQKFIPLPAGILTATELNDTATVEVIKAAGKQGDEVVMDVIIGGKVNPFVDGRAMMTVVDVGLPNKCATEEDHCDTPWDYCCADKQALLRNMATIQLVDTRGELLDLDLAASELNPSDRIKIKGVLAERNDPNMLLVNAKEIYITK